MAIKGILVQVDGGKAAPARYEAAMRLAQAHDAHVTGLCLAVEPPVPATILGMVPPEVFTTQRQVVLEQAEAAMAQFRFGIEKAGIEGDGRIVQVPGADDVDVFVEQARHVDIVMLGQSDPDEIASVRPGFAADVVMGCGRPVIVIPLAGVAATLGQRVLVAWNGSREATRAVNDAMPILEQAHAVTVLSVNPEMSGCGRRDPGADISLHLARHGVKVTAARTITRDISVGDAVLADIADNGIDLLVMGAYGHSRLREFTLGGVTRDLLAHMTAPVLMSH